jgi:hypothetical protein
MAELQPFDDIGLLVNQLSLEEKTKLLCGEGSFRTAALPNRGIPSILVSVCTRVEDAILTHIQDIRWTTRVTWCAEV